MKKILFTICLLLGITLGGLQVYSSTINENDVSTMPGLVFSASFENPNWLTTNSSTNPLVAEGTATKTAGITGQGAWSGSAGSWYTTNNATWLGTATDFTWIEWVKPLTQNVQFARLFDYSNIFIAEASSVGNCYNIRPGYYESDGTRINTDAVSACVPYNKWTCVKIRKSADNLTMWYNDTQITTKTSGDGTLGSTAAKIAIGGLAGGTTRDSVARIDEVRLYNRALTEAEMSEVCKMTSGGKIEIGNEKNFSDSLVAYHTFDGNKTTASVTSDSVSASTGTISGATRKTGVIGQGLSLDGINDYIAIATNTSQIFTDGFTFSFWVKDDLNQTSVAPRILDKSTGVLGNNGFYFYRNSLNRLTFTFDNASARNVTIPAYTKWTYLTITASPTDTSTTTVNIYTNGVYRGQGIVLKGLGEVAWTNNPITLGNRSTATDRPFRGEFDDFRFYSKPLSASEVTELYSISKGTQAKVFSIEKGVFKEDFVSSAGVTANGGTVGGTPTISQGADFNGTTDYIDYGLYPDLTSTSLSFAFTIRADQPSLSSAKRIVSGNVGVNFPSIAVLNGRVIYYANSARWKYSAFYIATSTEYRVVMTTDNTIAGTNIYINGVLSNGATSDSTGDVYRWGRIIVGRLYNVSNTYLDGGVKNLRIYTRILSQNEIKRDYQLFR